MAGAKLAMMSDAVIFDLFHTLIDTEHLRPPGFDAVTSIAALLGLDDRQLRSFWNETYIERETNQLDLVDLISRFAADHEIALSEPQRTQVDRLFGVVKDEALRRPRADMVGLVRAVAGQATAGVLSNCHQREVRCWPESPLAHHVTAFGRSCAIGVMKPHPDSYQWVLDALGVDAGSSIYVGNGSSDELVGAREAGFGSIIHVNIFDRGNGLVSPDDQARRATQADISVDTVDALAQLLLGSA